MPSLRHLVFAYTFNVTQLTEKPDSGEGEDNPSNGNLGTGPANGRFVSASRRSGTISVDVVAATADGSIVADVSEGDGTRMGLVVRCSVAKDATVVFDPRSVVSDEEQVALRYLARGFFAPSEVRVGASWPLVHTGTGFEEHATYHISALPASDRASIAFETRRSIRGARFIQASEHGTLVYRTDLLVPQTFASITRTLEQEGTHRISSDESIGLDLTADSFMKEKP